MSHRGATPGGCVVAIIGMVLFLVLAVLGGVLVADCANHACSGPSAPQMCQG